MNNLKRAFPLTLPVMAAYWFLGITYGLLAHTLGFSIWYPLSMALFIYSGSAEFLALGMLLADFNPVSAAAMGLVVGARHLFYGITMLDVYKGAHWRKPLLIFWLTDETFAVNYNQWNSESRQARLNGRDMTEEDKANSRQKLHSVMLWVSLLDYLYWITGGLMGYLFGSFIGFDTRGLEFVVTAMFTTIFIDQYLKERDHRPAWIGIGCTTLCLLLVGREYFIVPSMVCILVLLTVFRNRLSEEGES